MKINTKQKKLLTTGAVALAVVALLLPFVFSSRGFRTLQIHGESVQLEVVSTPAAQSKGLGGRATMSNDRGMLFTFAQPTVQCFWMKDMQFSLDIVWLNSSKKVVMIEKDVSPKTYPKAFCAPTTAYVIEINAGKAASLGIRTGETLRF